MNNVSRRMQQRGIVVAALGILFGTLSQASLTEATISGRPSAKLAGDLEPGMRRAVGQPQGPRRVAPAL